MKPWKIFLLLLLAAFIVIQFFPIEENAAENVDPSNDFASLYNVPPKVLETLQVSCYDCHSNRTTYLWYDKIQPIAWYIQDHVDEGKEELNFHEFGSYSEKKRDHKIDEVVELVEEGEMPLQSYTLLHWDAKMTEAQKAELVNWFKTLKTEEKSI